MDVHTVACIWCHGVGSVCVLVFVDTSAFKNTEGKQCAIVSIISHLFLLVMYSLRCDTSGVCLDMLVHWHLTVRAGISGCPCVDLHASVPDPDSSRVDSF